MAAAAHKVSAIRALASVMAASSSGATFAKRLTGIFAHLAPDRLAFGARRRVPVARLMTANRKSGKIIALFQFTRSIDPDADAVTKPS
jgi:hypothetical protein